MSEQVRTMEWAAPAPGAPAEVHVLTSDDGDYPRARIAREFNALQGELGRDQQWYDDQFKGIVHGLGDIVMSTSNSEDSDDMRRLLQEHMERRD